MRFSIFVTLALALTCGTVRAADETGASPFHIDHPGLKKLSWQLLCQTSTFPNLSVTQVMDLLHSNDFHHLELSAGQLLMPTRTKDVKIGPDMAIPQLGILQNKLRETHLDIVSYRATDFGHTEADARKLFAFAQRLGVKNIVGTPDLHSLDMLDRLANEYLINVAILAEPNDNLLRAIKQRSTRVGVCADILEWQRAGQNPVDGVRKLKGRILEVHLKDGNAPTETAAVADTLKELAMERFKGPFCVESDGGSVQGLAAVANNFSGNVTKLAAMP